MDRKASTVITQPNYFTSGLYRYHGNLTLSRISCVSGLLVERHSPAPSVAQRSRHDPRVHRLHRTAMGIHISGDQVSKEQEEKIGDAFERVAVTGLEEEQR